MLEIGTKAPEFCLPNQDEVEICLRDLKGKWIVLYFYPKDNTPGCTTQACDFTAQMPDFDDLNAIILGVSADSPKKHQNFIAKQNLSITLLSDEETTMMQEYGAWQLKKNYGKEYMGIVRSTYIINPKGEVAAAWDNVRVRVKRKKDGVPYEVVHVEEVKKSLAELQK
ncbi:MAG: peroxiredoxin [Helicobacteraceae bacterium]|jgi:peroxiredoxin Q/BCP|nr:peroxiredoxin [Helicobacteraceae bacterium]